jgi:hypothetical protein
LVFYEIAFLHSTLAWLLPSTEKQHESLDFFFASIIAATVSRSDFSHN